jgi:hypothetical protein
MASALPKVALIKSEATYKTDSVPTGALNAFLLRDDIQFKPVVGKPVERNNVKAFFGNNQKIMAAVYRTITFSVELAGSGTAGTAPKWGPALLACSMAGTANGVIDFSYSPVTDAVGANTSVTIYFEKDLKRHIMVGARGNAKFMWKNGELPYIQFEMTGLMPAAAIEADASYSAVTLTGWSEPRPVNFQNTTPFSLHAFGAAELYSLEINLGNQVTYRNVPNAEDVRITGAAPSGSISIAEPTIAQKNYFANMRNATLDVLSITHGLTPGNIIQADAPKSQITDVTPNAVDNVSTLDFTLDFIDRKSVV